MLRERECYGGGFGCWPGDNSANASLTCYVLDYLTEVKEAGHALPVDLWERTVYYLDDFAGQEVHSLPEARQQAYAIYLFTRQGEVTTPDLTNLVLYLTHSYAANWQQDLAGVYLAATYKLLQDEREAARLISNYKWQENSLADNAQYLTVVARHFAELLPKVGGESGIA